MKSNLILLSSLLMISASPLAMAQSASNQQNARATSSSLTQDASDQDFVQSAAIGNMSEIQLGKFAQQKSQNQDIKSFAQELIDDHQNALQKLKRQASDYSLPSRLDSEHQQMITRAQNAGDDFDRQFLRMQIDAHRKTIETYQEYADQGSDAGLKRYARNQLPTLRDHLRTARSLQNGGSDAQAMNAQSSTSQANRSQDGARAPLVTVRQGQPDVTVNQKRPLITVRQAPPRVTIEQPQPEIIVQMPEPDVNVERSRPQVSVQMPQPRVNVVGQSLNDDNVEINRSSQNPQVRYEKTGQPQVTYRQDQSQPRVRYEDMDGNPIQGDSASKLNTQQSAQASGAAMNANRNSSASGQNASPSVANTNVGGTDSGDWATVARTRANAGDTGAKLGGRQQQMRVGKLLDMTLYNAQGDDLGDVDQIVMNTDDDRRYLVLASGGFLGLFKDKVAIPLERVRYEGGRLVVRGLNENDIDQMQDWQNRVPHRRVLNSNDIASLTTTTNG